MYLFLRRGSPFASQNTANRFWGDAKVGSELRCRELRSLKYQLIYPKRERTCLWKTLIPSIASGDSLRDGSQPLGYLALILAFCNTQASRRDFKGLGIERLNSLSGTLRLPAT